MTTQKPLFASMLYFLSALWAVLLGFLFRFRALPFLQADTILSGGKQVPTEQFVRFASTCFWGGAAVVAALGIVGILTLNEPRRRYITALPRLQQWMFWPFHGITSSAPPTA